MGTGSIYRMSGYRSDVMRSKLIRASVSLLLALTGIAAAMDAQIMDSTGANPAPAGIALARDQSVDLNFRATGICPVEGTSNLPLSLPVSAIIVPLNGGSASDLAITGIPVDPANMTVGFNNPKTLVPFTVKNIAAPPGTTYRVTVVAGEIRTGLDFGSASRQFQSVPEFATVAMPIAAVMGLIFAVYHRRTEK